MNKVWAGIKLIAKWITCPIWGPFYGIYVGCRWVWRKVRGKSNDNPTTDVSEEVSDKVYGREASFVFTTSRKAANDMEDDSEPEVESLAPIVSNMVEAVRISNIHDACRTLSNEDDLDDCIVIYDPEGVVFSYLKHSSGEFPMHLSFSKIDLDVNQDYSTPYKYDCQFIYIELDCIDIDDTTSDLLSYLRYNAEIDVEYLGIIYQNDNHLDIEEY